MIGEQLAFSERVTSASWRAAATEWITDVVARSGRRLTGPVRQPRIRPWSTQLVVPTDHGELWFKATCRGNRFEVGVHQELAGLVPETVLPPLAVDRDRGWMITSAHGPPPVEEPDTSDWCALVQMAARCQQRLREHGTVLLDAGLPDHSPATVPERFDQLLDALEALDERFPCALGVDEAADFRRRRPALVDACDLLAGSSLPVTFEHGDLHWSNVHGTAGRLRLFDFGDASWAHAVETLAVPEAVARLSTEISWDRVADVYRHAWDVDHATLGLAQNAATFTHAVNRAATWWRCLAEADESEWEQWGEAPIAHLRGMMGA